MKIQQYNVRAIALLLNGAITITIIFAMTMKCENIIYSYNAIHAFKSIIIYGLFQISIESGRR